MRMDLFELLQDKVGCEYISDMRSEPHRSRARKIIKELNLEDYTLTELSDMAEYLYDRKPDFSNMRQAQSFFLCEARGAKGKIQG